MHVRHQNGGIMTNLAVCMVLCLMLAGCATGRVIPVGTAHRPPLPDDAPVYIFSSEKEVGAAFTVIGILSYTDPGKYQILSLASVIPEMQKQARRAGANGLIIDENHVVKSGIISTGIGITARAIVVEK